MSMTLSEMLKKQSALSDPIVKGTATAEQKAEFETLTKTISQVMAAMEAAKPNMQLMKLSDFQAWAKDAMSKPDMLDVLVKNLVAVKAQGKTNADDQVLVEVPTAPAAPVATAPATPTVPPVVKQDEPEAVPATPATPTDTMATPAAAAPATPPTAAPASTPAQAPAAVAPPQAPAADPVPAADSLTKGVDLSPERKQDKELFGQMRLASKSKR